MTSANGQPRPQADCPPATVEALAQLKEAIGLLWRRVDEAEAKASQEAQQTHQKLDTWIQTNLTLIESNQELIKAVVLNSQESRQSIEYLEKGTQQSAQLSDQLQQFAQLTRQLQHTLKPPIATSSSSSPALQALSHQLTAVQVSIDQLQQTTRNSPVSSQLHDLWGLLSHTKQTIDRIGTTAHTISSHLTSSLEKTSTSKDSQVAFVILVIISFTFLFALFSLRQDSSFLVDRVSRIMWKLQAIEQKWGG